MGNHALIFGATGIQGWAIANQLLHGYPTPSSFDRITSLTNRPITENTLWPKNDKHQVISGINLLGENIEKEMKERIPNISGVTHIFFGAYIFDPQPDKECAINTAILRNAVTAVETLSSTLKFVVLPTGAKAYGILLDQFPHKDRLPLPENLPRLPEPHASQLFYYHQTDWLSSFSRGKPWTWCELRPDIIVGFVPTNNAYNAAQGLATYLALYRELNGEGAEHPVPGTEKAWTNLSNDSSQDIIAKFAIHCALHPETCGQGQAFNVASQSKPTVWKERWPVVCEFFGLKGTGPVSEAERPQTMAYIDEHLGEWKGIEKKYGLVKDRIGRDKAYGGVQQFFMVMLDFDRQLDLSKQHSAWSQGGEVEEYDVKKTWWTAFQRFREAKIIP